MSQRANTWPDWERVLVGGTASAVYAGHRISTDADHVLSDLRSRFDEVLADLESVAGWRTARVKRPVFILGSLDGIETGVRQLLRDEPLETTSLVVGGQTVVVPTQAEMVRVKAVLVLRRNATRDYVDLVALVENAGEKLAMDALRGFDALYPQPNGESPLLQLQVQLAEPLPFDLEETRLAEYKHLAPQWQHWKAVSHACKRLSLLIFRHIIAPESSPPAGPSLAGP